MTATFVLPGSLEETYDLLAKHRETAKVVAGGTDIVHLVTGGFVTAEVLIGLGDLPLGQCTVTDEAITIGATCSLATLEGHEALGEVFPLLAKGAGAVGSPQVRNMGTIGGNLSNASPCADTAPPLLVADAVAVLGSTRGKREVPMDQLFTGPGRTVMARDELLVELRIPLGTPLYRHQHHYKFGSRRANVISVANAAIAMDVDEHGVITRVAVAMGSVGPTPVRARRVEALLTGAPCDPAALHEGTLLEALKEDISPIDDVRGSAAYRLHLEKVAVLDALRKTHEEVTHG